MKTAQKLSSFYKVKQSGSRFHYLTNIKPSLVDCDLSKATKATEQAFDFLNDRLFDGKVERVVITLQSSKGSYGHCSIGKIWHDGTENHSKREINLSVDYLSIDPFHYIGTLIHEMVHAYNLQRDILDCNPSNQYHNKKFKELAESVGLVVTKMGNYGFAHTRIAQTFQDGIEPVAEQAIAELRLQAFWNRADFDFSRGSKMGFKPGEDTPRGPRGGKGVPTGKGSGSKLKKWSCGCTNVRVATEFNATCNACGNDFELA